MYIGQGETFKSLAALCYIRRLKPNEPLKTLKLLLIPLQWIWRSIFFINAVLTFFVFFPFFFILLFKEDWFPLVFKVKKIWAHFILWPVGIFYKIDRKSDLQTDQAYVFCPNHTSYLDIMLIYIAFPVYFHTMGKAELLRVPLFSRFFSRMNIPVNRKSRKDSHRAYLRAAADIDKGISITLFPEGTIHHNGPVMGRFKNGPFRLAIEKQVPIVPVTFLNNWVLLPDDYYRRVGHPGVAGVKIHEPIPTLGLREEDLNELKEKVYRIINEPLQKKYPAHYEH